MKATILHVPTKKADDINWIKPIGHYIRSVYGDTHEFDEDLKRLNKLRQDIKGAHADNVGIRMYMRYFSYLELLDLRVPMDQVNKHKSLKFVWYDAFSPVTLHEQYALPFEKASTLFNLASLMSKSACKNYIASQRSTGGEETTFKDAIHLMQQAAGVFKFLGENFLNGPSNDLKAPTIDFLANLCLAQSQEMFNLKVIDGDLEQKKNNLIARLCASTAKYYDDCFTVVDHLLTPEGSAAINNDSTFALENGISNSTSSDEEPQDSEYDPDKNVLPDIKVAAHLDMFWVHTIQVKALYYKSLTYYFQALHLESGNKFGEAIAYLTKSSALISKITTVSLKAISKAGGEEAYDLLDNYKYQKDAVEIKLKDIIKDNDLIYHDIIPNVATITEPKPMDSAKAIPISKISAFSEINEHSFVNFLTNVIPINIHELLSYYSEEKSQLLRAEIDENDVATEKLASALESLKLPKALVIIKELIQNEQGKHDMSGASDLALEPETVSMVNDIASSYSSDKEEREDIVRKRDQIYTLVNNCQKNIDKIQFLNDSTKFREDLLRLKKSLYDAANSDSRLFELVDRENSRFYQVLAHGSNSNEFKSLFVARDSKSNKPTPIEDEISLLDIDDSKVQGHSESLGQRIKQIEDILNDLNIIKSDRQKLISSFKEDIHKDDISDIIMLNSKVKTTKEIKTEIFADELKKFNVYLKKLDELNQKQDSFVAKLQSMWQDLTSNPKVREVQTLTSFKSNLRDEQLSRISSFYKDWRKYTTGLRKGVEYYDQLLRFAGGLNSAVEAIISRGPVSDPPAPGNIRPGSNQFGNQFGNQGGNSSGNYSQQQEKERVQETAPRIPPRLPGGFSGDTPPRIDRGLSFEQPDVLKTLHSRPELQYLSARTSQQSGEGLIYDQPSAYQPNMYNFFLKNT